MGERAEHALALARAEARLQQPDFLHRQREAARQGDGAQLLHGDPVRGATLRLFRGDTLLEQAGLGTAVRRPQQQCEQERRRDRLVVGHARIGVGQAFHQHAAQRTGTVGLEGLGAFGEQHVEQAVTFQAFEAGDAVPGQEQLQHFFEQARRGGLVEQVGQVRDRCGGAFFDLEAELGSQAHGTQHAHRVFLVALHRIADELHQARLHVFEAAGVIAHREILDGVVQGVAGEVAADGIVFDGAVHVVAHEHAVFHFAVAAAVIAVGAEGGDFDDLAAEDHVGQAEPASDQAAVAEQLLDLFGRGVGSHVEILGAAIDQQIAHGAADKVGAEAGIAQAVQHAQSVRADVLAGDRVLVARDDAQAER